MTWRVCARNLGSREARNPLVLLIDNDVELMDGCLERMFARLCEHDDLTLLQARSLIDVPCVGQDGEVGPVERLVHYDGASFHYLGFLSLRNWYRPLVEAEGVGLVDVDCAIALCCLARAEILLEVGGYDEPMFYLMEDAALSYALRLAGHRIAVDEEALCLHRGGTEGLSTRGAKSAIPIGRSFLQSRNRWMFVLTHYRLSTLVLLGPGFFLYGVVHTCFAFANGQGRAWLRGKAGLFKFRAYLWERRAFLQKLRKRGDKSLLGCPELTFNPGLADRGFRALVRRTLSFGVKTWYLLVGWMLR